MNLKEYFEKKARGEMKLPKCEYCELHAQYDFVDNDGEWRYGCITHWMKHRASRQLGHGHARHLVTGETPPKRPEGYVPKPIDPTHLVKPRIAPTLAAYTAKKPESSPSSDGTTAKERREKRPKASREFQDMEPQDIEIKEPRPGSVMAVTLDLIRQNNGATIDEIQNAIGPKHDALKLLQWMNENRGHGWKRDAEGKIHVVYYQKSS